MGFFTVFPLMCIPVVIYNFLAVAGSTFTTTEAVRTRLDTDFMTVPMANDTLWHITPGHALIAVSYTHLTLPTIYSV